MANILVIDDEELALFTMRELLEDAGHAVTTAENGVVGLAHLDSGTVDLVITDMVMPHMEGTRMIAEIRQRNAGLPIIAMSGGARTQNIDTLELARQFGANAALNKPFSGDQLMAVVASCLGGRDDNG